MDLGLHGRIAYVTGSSRGLGFAVARALAREGCDVALCARDADVVEKAAAGIERETGVRTTWTAVDLSDAEGPRVFVEHALGALGPASILVVNTGGPKSATFGRTTGKDWDRAYELLLRPVQSLVRLCAPHMVEAGWGRILAIASVAVKAPIPDLVLSNSLRAAVAGLMKTLSREFAPGGVTVNTLCPGFHLTERLVDLAASRAAETGTDRDEVLARMASSVPAGRIGDPGDFGSVAAFLCSRMAGYVTGTLVQVDGGLYEGLV